MLTEDQLRELEELGKLFFAIGQCAIILQIDGKKLKEKIDDAESAEHHRYWKGYLQSEAEVRKSIIDVAKRGSAPAQSLVTKIIDNSKVDNG